MLPKTIIALCLVVAFNSTVEAQPVYAFGLKAGASISNIRIPNSTSPYRGGTPVFPDENVVNPFAGIFLESAIPGFIPVELEVFYTRMGAKRTMSIPVTTEQSPDTPEYYADYITEIGLHYLVAGLNVKPGISLGSMRVYARSGPTISYLIGMTNLAEFRNTTERYVAGYQIGIGVQFDQIMEQAVLIELTHARNFSYFYHSSFGDYYNVSWFVTVGVSL